ncbi:hypothetical protein EMIHUDRAFT_463972 [Emiliania huxleyi CCMP1516]|uniref:Uncharacterized protein n=2 Tax=Emiliania huxleyi TaxID=2903 RepID=A0A0D3J955_EMIH1|nr:hypothetical protein EMIHUDRAFT_463972 [Emiliania huxleyi CCMP1516]EOD20040.1 hypothetical protein EMIHUDRAFT_463972 [Emiliania huxleyi CCMP1516]|eukprot:XP_005772469.1 hypothetical protein EMIHUDRAFT_463972 [Emiliania huxleyi CCMP1516]
MRFFGDSMPFGEDESFRPDPTHLGLLSVEQALADDASLILKMKERYDTPGSPPRPVGTLAYMLRQKYPHVARAESAYPLARSPVVEACATVAAASGSLSAFAPLVVPHGSCPLEAEYEVVRTFGSCLDVSRLEATGLAVRPGSLAARGRVGGPKTANKAWDYLACTEIVHPIAANNVSDMFPPQTWSVDALSAGCRREFHAAPRPAWMPRSMGMARGAAHLADATSHVIFTNGLLDPWSAQSVTQNVSSTLVAINIPDGSHHSDLGAPPNPDVSEADSPTLRAARAQQLAILKGWLEERAAPTVAVV